jgi:Tfp pilus assembly protein PilF
MSHVISWKSSAKRAVLVVLVSGVVSCGPSPNLHVKADENYRLAQQYLGGNSYLMAEQEIRKALDLVPHDARYYELLALIYQAQGRLKHADEAYRLALQQPDAPPSVQVNFSTLLLQRDRYDEAISLAQQALRNRAYSKPALAYTNIGLAYLKKGMLLPAEEHLRTALEYEPSLPEAHHNLGLVYAREGKSAQAILSFREAIRVRPSYAEAYASLGQLLL